jgi:hypothetical protein
MAESPPGVCLVEVVELPVFLVTFSLCRSLCPAVCNRGLWSVERGGQTPMLWRRLHKLTVLAKDLTVYTYLAI